MTFSIGAIVAPPAYDAIPTQFKHCEFADVEVIDRDGWHWRSPGLHGGAWSLLSFLTAADAYQGAAFAYTASRT